MRPGQRAAHEARRSTLRRSWRDRGNDDGRDPSARDDPRRAAEVPGHRGQRGADQAHVRQPLRHRAIDAGCGWCGRGLASRAHGMGAHVIVTEVDPTRALEALMDGYRVMPLIDAVRQADIVLTVTGDVNVVDKQHFEAMKDGCIIANSGHFNDEINIPALAEMSRSQRVAREFVREYEIKDGRRIYLLADGRLLNLAAAEGHPAAVMDMSFANQALSAVHIAHNHGSLAPGVYDVPQEIDKDVARLKLESLGVKIDALTEEQQRYLASWDMGT